MSSADSNRAFHDFTKTLMAVIIFATIVGALFWTLINVISNNALPLIAILPIAFGMAVLALAYRFNVIHNPGRKMLSYLIVLSFILSSLMVISTPVSATPTTVISDDFESGMATFYTIPVDGDVITQSHSPTHSWQISGGNWAYGKAVKDVAYPNTIDLWFRPSSSMTTYNDVFRCYDGSSVATGACIRYTIGEELEYVDLSDTSVDSIASVTLDAWHHLVVIQTDTSHCTITFDGANKGSFSGGQVGGDIASIWFGVVLGTYGTTHIDDLVVSENSVSIWKPTFLNSPLTIFGVNGTYYYNAQMNESCTFTMLIKPSWATLSGGNVSGVPDTIQIEQFSMKATSVNGSLSEYKNWSLLVTSGLVNNLNYEPFNNLTQWNTINDIYHCVIENDTYVSAPNSLEIQVGSGSYDIGKSFNPVLLYPMQTTIHFQVEVGTVADLFNFHPLEVNALTCAISHNNLNNTFEMYNIPQGLNYTFEYVTTISTPYAWNELTYYLPDGYHIFYQLNGVALPGPNADGSWNQTGYYLDGIHGVNIEANEPTGHVHFDDLSIGSYTPNIPIPVTPYFTSSPITSIENGTMYRYNVTTNTTTNIAYVGGNSTGWLGLSNDGAYNNTHQLNGISPLTPGYYTVELMAWITYGYFAYQNFTITVFNNASPPIPPVYLNYSTTVSGSLNNSHPHWNTDIIAHGVFTYSSNGTRIANANLFFEIHASNGSLVTSSGMVTNANGEWQYNDSMLDIRSSGWTDINGSYYFTIWFEHSGLLNSSNVLNLSFTVVHYISPVPLNWSAFVFILLAILMFPLGLLMRRWKKVK